MSDPSILDELLEEAGSSNLDAEQIEAITELFAQAATEETSEVNRGKTDPSGEVLVKRLGAAVTRIINDDDVRAGFNESATLFDDSSTDFAAGLEEIMEMINNLSSAFAEVANQGSLLDEILFPDEDEMAVS